MVFRDLHTHAVLQMIELAAAERVHVLHLLVVDREWIVFVFLFEEEPHYREAHQHQEAGRYHHDGDDRSV